MPPVDSQQILSLSAPAILIVWTLREVFSYLLKMQNIKKEESRNQYEPEMVNVLKSLAANIENQTRVLNSIYLELRENSVRIEHLDKQISQIPKH